MLDHYIENLKSSIQWAQCSNDFDVLCLAKERMNQLMEFAKTLSVHEQLSVHLHVEKVLPMEWPLWMEACRYQDCENICAEAVIFH